MIATCEEQARAKVTLAGGKNDQRYRVVGVFRTRSLVVLARLHLSEDKAVHNLPVHKGLQTAIQRNGLGIAWKPLSRTSKLLPF